MIVCYSGLCSSPPTLASSAELKSESCHKMNNHQESENNSQLIQYSNDRTSHSSACCFDSLLTSADDNSVKAFSTLKPAVIISGYDITKDNLIINSTSLREHGPPDLQILHSTFQI